eukprot:1310147-Pleurochrysis_carterae.AAC.1
MSVKSHCSRWNARLTDACSYALKSRAASRHSHVRTFAACHAACVATRRTARATSASEAAATAAVAASMAAASREACVSTSRRVLAACHDAESVSWPMARAVVAPRNEESSRCRQQGSRAREIAMSGAVAHGRMRARTDGPDGRTRGSWTEGVRKEQSRKRREWKPAERGAKGEGDGEGGV